ncbi:FkbM family methyltransferase [Gammaproteobacteria bacterium]|nr:FkbM family methyltransferase [Gammaproteobacteria bacterium]
MIRSTITKLYRNYAVKLFKIHILKDGFLIAHRQWVNDNRDNDESLRYEYSLNENSIVFDIGGYEGEFAQKIFDRFGCTIYVFEPVKEYYHSIVKRFKNNPKIKIFDFGLSDIDEMRSITLSDNGTSVFIDKGEKENISLKSAADFLNKNDIESIDLLKINTEGGEFSVLPDLIENYKIHNIKNLQIQFHNFVPDAERLREKIRNDLKQTHHLTYDYYFVWENWELNE